MSVQFYFKDTSINIPQRKRLRSFIIDIFNKEGYPLHSIDYIFCSDQFLLKINRDFLNHDYYTDIITFNLGEGKQPIIGEIYISADRVKENARIFKTSFKKELHRVVFHGVLHLCGYKDKSKDQVSLMRSMEDRYLALYFTDVPRITVSH